MRPDKFGCGQHVKVKRKRWSGQPETTRDCSCGKSIGRMPDKQAKDTEPRLLGQRSQRIDSKRFLHISKTMEMYDAWRQLSNGNKGELTANRKRIEH
jgi:hypothetical protein